MAFPNAASRADDRIEAAAVRVTAVVSEVILARCDRCLDEVSEAPPGPNYRY
jgi:hypothetical protein